ncbi:HlyD family efflux transporter periplasmic adaptor subunit [Ciceribacter sp. L1K23]|uniref:efflux RND transporter periplasmic adaptor subunit n=1 Tax=Ciceribacter sp. L1K23 TaxID=2820276 RepID=UPI001B83C3C8|nr:HlyD family efflux transporter periplasmic adaptor subunit [Ciceribacter sp. L1K23]
MNVLGRRIIIWGGLFAVLTGGIVYSFRPQPVAVDLATVRTAPLRVAITEEGKTRVSEVYTLHAPLRGNLDRLTVEPGDAVLANDTVLANITPAVPEFLDSRSEAAQRAVVEAAVAARALALAELDGAKVNLDFARAELDRAQAQSRHEAISKRALDEAERAFKVAETSLATARAALDVREFELARARSQLLPRDVIDERGVACDCVRVKSPVSGVVLQVLRRSEGVVEAGSALLEIGDSRKLEVAVDLLSEEAVTVTPGQRAVIRDWGGPQLEGRVRRVEPYGETKVSALGIEEQRVTVVLDLLSPPDEWKSLGHGFRVDVDLIQFEAEVPQLPLGAFFRDGEDWAVFVVEDGRAKARKVRIGHRNTLAVEIADGVADGDQVVLYPGSQINDGLSVEQRETSGR